MSKTPGPWEWGELRHGGQSHFSLHNKDGRMVMRCDRQRGIPSEEDAALIASAPELAEQLRVAKLQLGEWKKAHDGVYARNIELIRLKAKLEHLARRFISDRACICNKPGHRCGTNNMLEDLEGVLSCVKCEGTGVYLEASGDDPMPRQCECRERRDCDRIGGCLRKLTPPAPCKCDDFTVKRVEEIPVPKDRPYCGVWVGGMGPCVAEVPCHAHEPKSEKREGASYGEVCPKCGLLARITCKC